MWTITTAMQQLEGSVSNCLLDEKKWSVVVSFGLPYHRNDALRAVQLVMQLQAENLKVIHRVQGTRAHRTHRATQDTTQSAKA